MSRGLDARALAARLVRVGPAPEGALRVAIRAGISILVPLLVLLALDRMEWALYATFGAFTSLYGRERVDLPRVLIQLTTGAVFTAMVVLGVVVGMSDQRAWWAVPVAAVVAVVASALSAWQQWHPPGALFQVFAVAAVASIPATTADLLPGLTVAGLTALFAVAVGNVGAVVRRVRRTAVLTEAGPPIGGVSEGLWRYAIEAGVGVALAGAIATAAGIGRPYWAMVSAVVPLIARDMSSQLVRGLHRIIGTLAGLVLAWALLSADLHGLAVVVVAATLQSVIELVIGRNYALGLLFITPLALMMVHVVAPVPVGELLADRGVETVIGVVIGLAVGAAARLTARPAGPSAPAGPSNTPGP